MKYNILHITPDFNYACGRSYYVYLLMKYLHLRGHNVTLLTNKGDSLDRLDDFDIPYILKSSVRNKGIISFTRGINSISGLIRQHDFHIIHSYNRYSELLAVQAARLNRKKKIKTVLTSLNLVNRRYSLEFRSDKIIAVNYTIRNMLRRKFRVKDNKIVLIPNFTDTDELNEMETFQEGTKDHGKFFNVLSAGRFNNDKNYETLFTALKLLDDKSVRLLLIGTGENLEKYKVIIKKNKLNVDIIKPQKNLSSYFLIADVCVLPSKHNPFPTFMLQSGLHKKPFIGSNIDGIAELVKNNYNGLLFDNKSPLELAYKIYQFKTDKNLAWKCASNLHNKVINRYTQEFVIPKIERVYRDLAKS